MNKTLLRAGALTCALMTSTALTAPALAQSAPPPVNHNIDQNGVDVVLGSFEMSQTLVSVGPDAPHGLRLVRMLDGGMWTDNYAGGIHQSGADVFVSIGATSAKFTYSGGLNLYDAGTFSTAQGNGATLTRSGGAFTFTNSAGEVSRFSAEINSSGRIVAGTGRAIDLTYPNGTVITLNYRTETVCDAQAQNCGTQFRRQSVTNNFNYQLHFDYAQETIADDSELASWQSLTSVTAINTAVESCNAFADSCTLTNAWPTVTFGADGNDETVTLPDTNVWRFTFAVEGPVAIRRPGSTNADVTIGYDGLERVESVTGAAGTWNYSYSDSGTSRTTTVQGPLSGGRTVASDIVRQIILTDLDALGRTTAFQYDGSDRVTRITAPEGNYTQFTYDGRGNVTETRAVAKSGSGLSDLVATASFSSSCANPLTCNRPTATTDARGNTTDYSWSSTHGGVLTVTGPAPTSGAVRPQTRHAYTSSTVGGVTVYLPSGIAACQTTATCTGGADEAVTSISYTGSNFLPTGITRGNGAGTLTATGALAYDDIGNLITFDGPLSGTADTTRIRYNALRQQVGVIGPDPDGGGALEHRARRVTYDSAGLPAAIETGRVDSQSDSHWAAMEVLESVTTERDALGRPIVQRLVSGATTYALTQTGYDGRGRVQCVAQRMNPSQFATSALPSDVCTLDTEGSYGADRITRMTYDAADQVTLVQTGYAVTGVAADEVATTYSDNGRAETVTDAEGNRTTYEYDGFDRLRNTRFPSPTTDGVSAPTSGTGADYEQLGYDAGGNVTTSRLRSGETLAFTYDALNRLIHTDMPNSATQVFEPDIDYSYDLLGRLLAATDSNTNHATFTYDALGRVTSEANLHGSASMQYDAAGRRTRLTYPGSGLYVDYVYNVAGDMTEIRENGVTSGLGRLAAYVYDDRGRPTSLTRGNGTVTTYAYDDVSRLTELAQNPAGTGHDLTLGFALNPAGQIATNTRDNIAYSFTGHANGNRADTVNGLNQVTATGSTSVSHDARGNVSAIGSAGYTYNAAGELIQDGASGRLLYYDPLGRLSNVIPANWSSYRISLYDGHRAIAEDAGYGTILRRFVFGPGIDEPLVWYEGSGTSDRRWLHADERGSIVAVSNDSGAVTAVNRYDEYGVPQGTLTGRFGYTGQAWIPELGLYYYRARIYNPNLGRFMQTDPIGYRGGMNLYAYVLNDPVNLVDPLGLQEGEDGGSEVTVEAPRSFPSWIDLTGLPMIHEGRTGILDCAGGRCEFKPDVVVQARRRQTSEEINENLRRCGGGRVTFIGTGVSIVTVLGGSAVVGSLTTAAGGVGTFETDAWGFGFDLSLYTAGGTSPSIETFTGFSDNISVSVGNWGVTASRAQGNGRWGVSGHYGRGRYRAGGSITESYTWLTSFNCLD